MSTPAQRTVARLMIDRLTDAHANSPQRIVGSEIFREAADTIRTLLADEEERYRRNIALVEKNKDLSSRLDDALKLKDKLLLDTGKGCSVCGHTPVVNIPGGSGTYWLCGDCVGERLEELSTLRDEPTYRIRQEQAERIEELESRLDFAEMRVREIVAWFDVIANKYADSSVMESLRGEWPTHWLSEVRPAISGCGVEIPERISDEDLDTKTFVLPPE